MGTPFTTIYAAAVFRFTDPRLVELFDEYKEEILCQYLYSACADFVDICAYDLTDIDTATQSFNARLDNKCIEILAAGVAFYWLSAQTLDERLLKNKMSTKDYTFFSPANLLASMTELRSQVEHAYRMAIINYSYEIGDIEHPGA